VSFKIPESVLVVIYTADLEVLILERADHPGFWQSVTGSKDSIDEPLLVTARREVLEETGIDCASGVLSDWQHAIEYDIYSQWRDRYAPGVTRNREHWFGLLLGSAPRVRLAPREHLHYQWLDYHEAARRCFSPSNAEAILQLKTRRPPA
jgi:dATP pyrophosphohydrolase